VRTDAIFLSCVIGHLFTHHPHHPSNPQSTRHTH
jgi:hypothetical protein